MKRYVAPILVFVGLVVLFFAPVFFGYVLLPSGSDLAVQYYPYFDFYSKTLQAGESFLWVPYIYSGFPAYVSQVGGFLDPVNIVLGLLFSAPLMVELRLMLDMFLTCLCAYLAARAMGLSRTASLLVGPSYIISFDWLYSSNPLTSNTLFLLPLLLFAVVQFMDRKAWRWLYVVLGGVALGWTVLCGYTQVLFYAVVLTGLYACAYGFLSRIQLVEWGKLAAAGVLLVGIGTTIGLPQILPAFSFLSQTSRSTAASYEEVTLKVIAPGDLLTSLVPPNFYIPYITPGRKPLYVGALWMFFAVGAITLAMSVWRRRDDYDPVHRHMAAAAFVFLFAFIAALKWSPLYFLLNKFPVFNLFRFPFRFMFLGTFLLALLGSFGFERMHDVVKERFWRWWTYGVGTLAAVFALGVVFLQLLGERGSLWLADTVAGIFNTTLTGHLFFHKEAASYTHAFETGVAAYRELLSLSSPAIALPFISLVASVVFLFALLRNYVSYERARTSAICIALLTSVSMALIGWTQYVPRETFAYASPFAPILSRDPLYRVYPFLVEEATHLYIPPQYKLSIEEGRAVQQFKTVGETSDLNIHHTVYSVDGYDQYEPSSVLAAMGRIGGELAAGYGSGTPQERTERLLSNLGTLGMMGGKYIVTGEPLKSSQLRLVATSSVTEFDMELYLYEYPLAFPRYFVAAQSCVTCAPLGQVTPRVDTNGHYEFSVDVPRARTLVLEETNLPGWRVLVDGKESAARKVNEFYMGVDVAAGKHVVSFEYQGMIGELRVLKALGLVH